MHSCFQFIFIIFIFNSNSKHRKKYYANKIYIFYISAIFVYTLTLLTNDSFAESSFSFGIIVFTDQNNKSRISLEKFTLLIYITINLFLSMSFEKLVDCLFREKKTKKI